VFKPAINLALTPGALKIGKEVIVPLNKGNFKEQYYSDGQIPQLVELLKPIYEEKMEQAELTEDPEDDQAIVLVQADKGLDYRTIYLVLRSASVAGFDKYRLAIMKK